MASTLTFSSMPSDEHVRFVRDTLGEYIDCKPHVTENSLPVNQSVHKPGYRRLRGAQRLLNSLTLKRVTDEDPTLVHDKTR